MKEVRSASSGTGNASCDFLWCRCTWGLGDGTGGSCTATEFTVLAKRWLGLVVFSVFFFSFLLLILVPWVASSLWLISSSEKFDSDDCLPFKKIALWRSRIFNSSSCRVLLMCWYHCIPIFTEESLYPFYWSKSWLSYFPNFLLIDANFVFEPSVVLLLAIMIRFINVFVQPLFIHQILIECVLYVRPVSY